MSSSASSLNKNNSAVKRIMQEAKELMNDPSTDYSAAPLEDDIFEWHCTLRGPADTEFAGGLYHFRILLPAEYPFRPPSIMLLTPNGRFELNTKICISFTNYHEELWQPAWGVRTAIIGLQGFFPLKGQAAVGVGSIEYPTSERKRLATLSREWVCPHCEQTNLELLPDPPSASTLDEAAAEQGIPSAHIGGEATIEAAAESQPSVSKGKQADGLTTAATSVPHVAVGATSTTVERESPAVIHNIQPLLGGGTRPASFMTRMPTETPPTPFVEINDNPTITRRGNKRPPVLLDTAICVLLVIACAMFCRRLV